ncbi:MAG: RNA 2',3'-cyclic phosphodiesterase [Oxalobacteraceae bacterium]|nr:RNA 2',3'-cyclic phosphodiesterase [Oxalobacteraceae bacterium]
MADEPEFSPDHQALKAKERKVRLFYALWPDDATRSALVRLQAPIQGRITPAEDLHLTLVFLGAQATASLPALQSVLAKLPPAAITLQLDCLGYFPRNGVAWAGAQHVPDALAALNQSLLAALAQHNIAVDQSARFKAHITLARNAPASAAAPDMTPIVWRADHVALVQSTGSAPRYRLLASRRLEDA